MFDYSEENFVPKSGTITVIDNNRYSDGADVVVIEDATDIKLDGVNKEENKIYSVLVLNNDNNNNYSSQHL